MFMTPVTRRPHAFAIHPASRLMRTAWSQPSAVDRWLDAAWNLPEFGSRSAPAVRVQATDSGYTLTLDVPGLSREHVRVAIEGAVVRVNTTDEAPRSLRAAWELPTELDADSSSAQVADGVLTLKLVRVQPVSRERVLEVH
jgi:HSP20 family protein